MNLEHRKRVENVEDGTLRTIECLRGRLDAERQASKAAEEKAQLIMNKLKELDEKLKEEMRLKDKATKKLKFLERKLKSKTSSLSKESEESTVSESCTVSSTLTTVTSRTNPEQDQEQNHETSVVSKFDVSQVTEPNTCYGLSCSSSEKCSSDFDVCKSDEQNSAVSLVIENKEEDYVHNSFALVPITMPEESQAKEHKVVSKSVCEVLETLRRAREGIRRNMKQNDGMKLRTVEA